MRKAIVFHPDGNDLKKVLLYYGIEPDDKILCPFHDDNNPSCHLNYDDGLFNCFACGAHGDALGFVRLANPKLNDLQKLILYHAILKSDKVKKMKVANRKSIKKTRQEKAEEKASDLAIAHDFYYGLKTIDWRKEENSYKEYMVKRGFTSRTLNMCKAKLTYTDNSYPLIFPILDNGVFRGYVCRTTNKVIEKKRKYLYNKGFSRIDTLGGNYKSDTVVLVEGYMDCLKMRQHGLEDVAAIFGWKITNQQIDKLRKAGVKTVISALDTDVPGMNGTDYLNNFFDVIRFQFPKGVKDPGDLDKEQFNIAYKKTKILLRSRRK